MSPNTMKPVTDHSPSTRLKPVAGEVWVEIRLRRSWSATPRESAMLDDFIALVGRRRIGRYAGRSSGGGAMDVTFEVKDRATAAAKLRRILADEFVIGDFSVSARYLAPFHDPDRVPPASARTSMSGQDIDALFAALAAELQNGNERGTRKRR